MDLDAYVAAHQGEWDRLSHLVSRRGLSGPESDELVDGYQRVATHLSVVRSSAPDPSLVAYLSVLLAKARTRSAGTRTASWSDVATFFTDTFPAALYRTRRWWVTTALVNVVVAFVVGWWFLQHPRLETSLATPAEIDRLVNSEFAGYYSQFAPSHFALRVWTNNVWVAALCVAFGVLGLPVIYLLWDNVLNVGVVGSIMVHHHRAALFFGLILPHGMLELTAVFVAGATGLRLFWAWVEPGPITRAEAVAKEGRSAIAVAMGLAAVLLVSGVIEAFVTPSALPTWARIGIGLVAETAFVTYVFTVGRWAASRGGTGDLSADDVGAARPTAG